MASGRWGGWLCALWALSCGDDAVDGGGDAGSVFDASGVGTTQSEESAETNHDDDTSADNSDSDNPAAPDSGDLEHTDGQETSPIASEPATTTAGADRDAGSSQATTTEAGATHSDTSSEVDESTQDVPDSAVPSSSGGGDEPTTDESALDASGPSSSSTEADELDASTLLDAAVTDSAASPSNTGTGNPGPTTPSPGPTTPPPHPTTPPGSDPEVDSGAVDAGPDDLSIYCSAVRDQYNVGGPDYTVLGADSSLGQTFTVGVNGRLAAVELKLGPQMVDPEQLQLEIFDNGESRGSVELTVADGVFGPLDASANAGPGYFDVTALRIDVYAGQVLYFEVTLPEQVIDSCEGGICEISEAYCDFDSDCAPSLTVGTEQHAPDDQENLYLGGMMFIDGAEYDHNDYFHDRDLQFKTVVLPIVDAPECVEITDASAGDAQASDAAP